MPQSRRQKQTLDDALNILSALTNSAAVASSAISVPALKPVVATLSAVIKRVKDVRTNSETELVFYEKTNALGEVITDIVNEANTSSGRSTSALQDQLNTLSRALTEIQVTADGLKGGCGFRGSIKRFLLVEQNKDALAQMTDQLTNAVTMFSIGMQGATGNAVHRIEHMAMTAEERRIIDAIPHVNAGYRSVDEVKSGFMPGTRSETLRDLETWAKLGNPADDQRRLWLLTAGAGLGKSAVAHQLCIRLAKEWGLELGASFFFSRGGVESARSLYPTIAHQLALSQPRLRPLITKAAQIFLDQGNDQQLRPTFEDLLLKPLVEQQGGAVFNQTTFIVIDGLDECNDRELVPELLRCLLELVRSLPWLRVLLATRPEPYILPVFTLQSATDIVQHRRLDDPQTMDESRESVSLYLHQTIPKIHPYGDFVRAHPSMLDRLVDRANGLFIYARIAINYLETIDTRPEEQFELLLSSCGAGLSPLDQLYLQILRLAFPSTTLQELPIRHRRVHDFLTFIALCHRALPPAAISLLLTLADDDVLWMAGRLRAVLLVNKAGNLVPLHATFAEFLVDSKRCIDPLYHIDPQEGHILLARKCFASFNVDAVALYLRSQSGSHVGSQAAGVHRQVMSSWRMYVTSWDAHLNPLKPDDDLRHDLNDMLHAQPMMVRLSNMIHGDIQAITRHVQDSEAAAAICSEHINFKFYCELWWRKMKGDCTARQAAFVTIAELEDKWDSFVENHNLKDKDYSKFSIKPEDIERYTTVLQGLVDKIRSSGTGELWYNVAIGERWWRGI